MEIVTLLLFNPLMPEVFNICYQICVLFMGRWALMG